jgi:hypothetical protein
MKGRSTETVGVRFTGWAAIDRDPQDDRVQYFCPHCGTEGAKAARRERGVYRFTDGFLQDLDGEMSQCRACRKPIRLAPVVLVHDHDERKRFEAVFDFRPMATSNN